MTEINQYHWDGESLADVEHWNKIKERIVVMVQLRAVAAGGSRLPMATGRGFRMLVF